MTTKVSRVTETGIGCTAKVLIDPYDVKSGKARVCRLDAIWYLKWERKNTIMRAGSCAKHVNIVLEELEGMIP